VVREEDAAAAGRCRCWTLLLRLRLLLLRLLLLPPLLPLPPHHYYSNYDSLTHLTSLRWDGEPVVEWGDSVTVCSTCDAAMHVECVKSFQGAHAPMAPTAARRVCASRRSHRALRCGGCGQHGGALERGPSGAWTHRGCVAGAAAASGAAGGAAGAAAGAKCQFCKRKCVGGCAVAGCTVVAHHFCAERAGWFSAKAVGNEIFYCAQHTPSTAFKFAGTERWVDTGPVHSLLRSLERARTLSDLVRRREKRKLAAARDTDMPDGLLKDVQAGRHRFKSRMWDGVDRV